MAVGGNDTRKISEETRILIVHFKVLTWILSIKLYSVKDVAYLCAGW